MAGSVILAVLAAALSLEIGPQLAAVLVAVANGFAAWRLSKLRRRGKPRRVRNMLALRSSSGSTSKRRGGG
jgi:hypothetical protein